MKVSSQSILVTILVVGCLFFKCSLENSVFPPLFFFASFHAAAVCCAVLALVASLVACLLSFFANSRRQFSLHLVFAV